ncbi:MAG: glycosyltransferase [Acidobacteriota bacterium]|nr:glycosyltransferase [Acidobacteriota bacterium]
MGELRQEIGPALSYAAADILLPNAIGEAHALERDWGLATPSHVVPNGVSPELFGVETGDDPGLRQRVICVGRLEPHKNQLGLIRALRGTGVPLAIVGPRHPHHPQYVAECLRAGEGWVEFLGNVDHSELAATYRTARVHVLPSWFETTGLVSLEAALCGCNVVSTSRGYASEYLVDMAWYCDPGDPKSIRRAVLAAWESPVRTALAERVRNHYTWDHVASATIAGYRKIASTGW